MTQPLEAILISPDGSVTSVQLPAADILGAMHRAIGCATVDVVRLASHTDMWVDDEGLFTQRLNPLATTLARRFGRTAQDYYGPALLAGVDPGTGDTTSLDPVRAAEIRAHLADDAAARP